jgi:TetR/AcrR family transcriptional regulator, repressor of fatR-cypB operon
MSIHSNKFMARSIDETKIERIKEATMQMVVSKGFGNASISEIAKKAGVAEGYLYNFYKSKTELVESLLHQLINELTDKLDALLNAGLDITTVFEQLIKELFSMANAQPEKIKFLYVLMNDYNFKIQESQRERIFQLCKEVKEKGIQSNEIRADIDEEEIYLIGVTYPIQFINLRFKNFFNRTEIGAAEIEKVLRICKNSLKN